MHAGHREPGGRFIFRCAVIWYATPNTGAGAYPTENQRCQARGELRYPGVFWARPAHGYPSPRSLPANPAALLARLRAAAARGATYWATDTMDLGNAIMAQPAMTTRSAVLFTLIERLLQVPIPASLRAALYEATARIPGLHLARHARDVAGRPGVGIVFGLPSGAPDVPPIAGEFILDPVSYRFLGMDWRLDPARSGPHTPGFSTAIGFAVIRSGLQWSQHRKARR